MFDQLKYYLALARVDHWFKNIFMLPGIIIPWIYIKPELDLALSIDVVVGILSACFIASANYVINEWLDAAFDKFHPIKKLRPSVTHKLKKPIVYAQYVLIASIGLLFAWFVGKAFLLIATFFLIMGFLYNVRPFRTKDRPYLDVLTESLNNPIRLTLGWLIVSPESIPPSSLLISYWFGGAFLMATKRFSEYRFINDKEIAGLYRKSFLFYNEQKLMVSILFYGVVSTFFLAIFLFKHRIELIISFPFMALIFAWYLDMGYNEDSPTQRPEKLYKQYWFILYLLFVTVLVLLLMLIDIPILQHYRQ
jgi:4-hydroxybenzoate polyprenyltransferase